MTSVRFVTLESFIPYTKVRSQSFSAYEYTRLRREFPDIYDIETTKNIFIRELKGFNPNTYYVFIAQLELIDEWEGVIKEYNLDKYLVYSSSALAQNKNYPDDGPRLKAYVFHGFNKE